MLKSDFSGKKIAKKSRKSDSFSSPRRKNVRLKKKIFQDNPPFIMGVLV
jgi:hypothetical protein